MAPLPMLKLAGLLVKTLAKPVANRLKVEAGKHPKLSAYIVYIGQFAHQISSRANVLAAGYRFLGVKPLLKEEALSKGVNFLSESLVFTVAGAVIVVEYARSEAKSAEKSAIANAKEEAYRKAVSDRIEALEQRISDLESSMSGDSKVLHFIFALFMLDEYIYDIL